MSNHIFSFPNFVERIVLRRQVMKDADTFIIIYGLPRTGKTTLGFQILLAYIDLMKKIFNQGYRPEWMPKDYDINKLWNPNQIRCPECNNKDRTKMIVVSNFIKGCKGCGYRGDHKTFVGDRVLMSDIFNNYFSADSSQMSDKIRHNPPGSPNFLDEGIDVMSWTEMMSLEQRSLMKLIQKTGVLHMPTILVVPSFKLLNKTILARSHYLFMVIDEPTPKGNLCYIFRNHTNPILAEEQPFGLYDIINDIKKKSYIAQDKKKLGNYFHNRQCFYLTAKYRAIDPKIYELYNKLVKEPLLNASNTKKKYVSYPKFEKVKFMLNTLLYNLYHVDGKSYAQIQRLIIDKFGEELASANTLKSYITHMSMTMHRPNLINDNVLEHDHDEQDNVEVEKIKDVEV